MPKRKYKRYRRSVVQVSAKRPIDKSIVQGALDLLGTAQSTVRIYPVTGALGAGINFPGTLTGLRWHVDAKCDVENEVGNFIKWAIVKCREGLTPNTMDVGAALATLYQPEQDVMAWGSLTVHRSGQVGATDSRCYFPNVGETKSMRKLMAGDALYFIAQDNSSLRFIINYTIQFFYKT